MTTAILNQIFPKAGNTKLNEIVMAFNLGYEAFSIDSNIRQAHFFAQVLQEVGESATTKKEKMNYSAEALMKFSYFQQHPEEAEKYGRTAQHPADQEAIANRAYAKRIGNGDVASGDGWKYRGKGFIQLTGKYNYSNIQKHLNKKLSDSGIDIVKNDQDILTVKGAMLSAMAFFSYKNIQAIADTGADDEVVDRVTAVVNKKTDSYPARVANFHRMKNIFGLN